MGRPCAIKVMHQVAMELQTNILPSTENETVVEYFDRECRFLESFQHPNIVEHWLTCKHPKSGSTMLVTELMDCNLRSFLFGLEFLPSHSQVSLSKDMASGLTYLHGRQILHRDLCGDNILLKLSQPVPVAKITDFGMSRLLDPSQMSHTLTAIGHRMGYLPPEALRLENEEYDTSLDVFSLGVIMLQIACMLETVKTAKDRFVYFGQIADSHVLKPLIKKCLSEDARKRPPANEICKWCNINNYR